jgi:hypothetical protein
MNFAYRLEATQTSQLKNKIEISPEKEKQVCNGRHLRVCATDEATGAPTLK